MIRVLLATFVILGAAITAPPGAGAKAREPAPLQPPQDAVLLEVTGKLAHGNREGAAQPAAFFDRAMLENLGMQRLDTSTDWTDGVTTFKGPFVRDLLERLGASGTTIKATAANDYSVEIPVSDFLRYPVILALEMNGKRLTLRDKGPIWIVYPRDDHPELDDPLINSRWIWQLQRIEVR